MMSKSFDIISGIKIERKISRIRIFPRNIGISWNKNFGKFPRNCAFNVTNETKDAKWKLARLKMLSLKFIKVRYRFPYSFHKRQFAQENRARSHSNGNYCAFQAAFFSGSDQSKEKKKRNDNRNHFLCANAISFLAYSFSQPNNFLFIPEKYYYYSFNITY